MASSVNIVIYYLFIYSSLVVNAFAVRFGKEFDAASRQKYARILLS